MHLFPQETLFPLAVTQSRFTPPLLVDRQSSAADNCVRVYDLLATLTRVPDGTLTNVTALVVLSGSIVRFEFALGCHPDYLLQARDVVKLLQDAAAMPSDLTNIDRVEVTPGAVHLNRFNPADEDDDFYVPPEKRSDPEWRIEGGDSARGDCGFCAYVRAVNPDDALRKFKGLAGNGLFFRSGEAEISVYINARGLTATRS